jgi:hypothetical protein
MPAYLDSLHGFGPAHSQKIEVFKRNIQEQTMKSRFPKTLSAFLFAPARNKAMSQRRRAYISAIGRTFAVRQVTAVAGLSVVAIWPAHATENGLFAGPIGGSDIRSAYLPSKTGLYVGAVGLGASYNILDGNNGQPSTVHQSNYTASLGGPFGLYVYPWKLDGGTLATGVSQSYDFIWERVGGTRKQANSGFNDTYADLLEWSKYIGLLGAHPPASGSTSAQLPYGLTILGAYSMVFSDGRYQVSNLATEGHNYNVYIPNIAVTYLTGPDLSFGDGTEISARLFYDIPTKNSADGYQSGQVLDVDWAVSERFDGLQAGIAGNYAQQTTPDIKNGVLVAPDGNILERASLGPVVAYYVPSLHATVKGKVVLDYLDRNTFGDRVTATLSIVFRVF